MMKKYLIILLPLALMTMASCGDDEDTSPSYADVNGFAPSDGDNSAAAATRRDFHDKTGSWLLFNDTLNAVSYNGKPELLDIGWAVIGSGSSRDYKYGYIADSGGQRKAADNVMQYLTAKLGKASPFAFMLVNDISYKEYGKEKHVDKILGTRAYVISTNNGAAYADPEGYFNDMLRDIIIDVLGRNSDKMEAFYAYSSAYYGKDLDDFGWETLTKQEIWNLGMFDYTEDDMYGSYFNYQETDVKKWVTAVLGMTASEFEGAYGGSATMMNKYNTLMGVLTKLGFKLN